MDKYDLAKLVQWAGTLNTRKKMQKVVYLLQAAKCPFDADYGLHHYGPYSSDVAQTTDVMVQVGLLEEEALDSGAGKQFNYRLTDKAEESVAEFEKSDAGQKAKARLQPFREKAQDLLGQDVRRLEMAATIAFFWRQSKDWKSAVEKMCQFKGLKPNDPLTVEAEDLARETLDA